MALYPDDGSELGRLIEIADSAMYQEKAGKHDKRYEPSQFRTGLPEDNAGCEAASPGRTGTTDQMESVCLPEESASANKSAPPPTASVLHAPY